MTDRKPISLISDVASYSNALKAKNIKIVVVASGSGDVTPKSLETVATKQENIIVVPEIRTMPSVLGQVEQAVANAIGMFINYFIIFFLVFFSDLFDVAIKIHLFSISLLEIFSATTE